MGQGFPDYRDAVAQGAVRSGADAAALAAATGLPGDALAAAIAETAGQGRDRFGRDLAATPPLEPPFHAVKVTGALFHTQGGLRIDSRARVLRRGSDRPLPNLLAGGGAARGVSGAPDLRLSLRQRPVERGDPGPHRRPHRRRPLCILTVAGRERG